MNKTKIYKVISVIDQKVFCSCMLFCKLTNGLSPFYQQVNAQVFEIASKLEETPIVGSPIGKVPSIPLTPPPAQEDDSLEAEKQYTDADINEVCV